MEISMILYSCLPIEKSMAFLVFVVTKYIRQYVHHIKRLNSIYVNSQSIKQMHDNIDAIKRFQCNKARTNGLLTSRDKNHIAKDNKHIITRLSEIGHGNYVIDFCLFWKFFVKRKSRNRIYPNQR